MNPNEKGRSLDEAFVTDATKEGWIRPLNHNSKPYQWIFAEPTAHLLRILKDRLRFQIAAPLKFREYVFPRLVPEQVLGLTGWLKHHPAEAWHVSQKREYRWDINDREVVLPSGGWSGPFETAHTEFVLDPIQCVSLYYALQGQSLQKAELPMKVFEEQGGWTWRYEHLETLSGLTKAIGFLRTEFVWLAHEEDAASIRNELLRSIASDLGAFLKLDFLFAKGESCFEEPPNHEKDSYSKLQNDIGALLNEPTIDLLLLRKNDVVCEVGSASRYSSITKRFKITCSDESYLWSGCLGVGLNRLLVVFLETHGFDPARWPAPVGIAWSELQKILGGEGA